MSARRCMGCGIYFSSKEAACPECETPHEVERKPQPNEAPRPSIVCNDCKKVAFTWTGHKCDPCWRKYMGFK